MVTSFKNSIGFSHKYQGKKPHKAEICTANPLLFLRAFLFHFQKTKLWVINLMTLYGDSLPNVGAQLHMQTR